MKNSKNSSNPSRTRRTFLQSMGMFIAGLGFTPPFFFFRGKKTSSLNIGENGINQDVVQLPKGIEAIWDLNKAYHETTPTREHSICLSPSVTLPLPCVYES